MRTQLLALFLIIGTALAVTSVAPNTGLCTCSQIQYQTDCLGVSIPNSNTSLAPTLCTWTANPNATGTQAKGTCTTATTTTTTTPVATYCSSISVTNCPSSTGCALPDGKTCQAFTGCSAYVFTTNSACQAVSTQCTTDGVQCAVKQICSYYSTTIANCGLFSSSSGTGTCKVSGTSCVDQTCTDAPTTLTTDAACNTFLSGCVSSGAGCISAHVSCATQTGTATTCPTFIGLVPSEGLCKYSGTGTACAIRTCADAATTLTTNAQCIAFLPSCLYTIGKGCVSSTQSCSQLTFSLGCSNLVNTSGVACTNDSSSNPATACREITCTDNTTATTTAACNTNGLTGCVTNGAGCVASANFACTSYTGTNAQCSTFSGANGPCKGAAANATTSQACVVRTCADAASTVNTNKGCAAIQTGCVTTGYGCVASLSSCSSYTPTASTPCDGYQGSDGPCTLLTGATQCSARTCDGASTTTVSGVVTTTNAGCQAWFPYISLSYPGCVTTGTVCVLAGTCTTLSQTSCMGYSTCSFTKSCVQNTLCSNYLTQSQCISNVGQFSRSCIWSGGACAPTACPVSAATITSDAACQGSGTTATPGCYYQGKGTTACVDATSGSTTCTSFNGDNTFTANQGCAVLFNNQCASADKTNSATVACVARTCANFYQATTGTTTTSQCNTWLSGCISDNYQGCVVSTADCTKFFGTQTTCNGITASGSQCYNVSSAITSTPCVVKTAAMIVSTAANQLWTDAQCQAALSTAVSSQVTIAASGTTGVCVANSVACSSFLGSLSYCSAITALSAGKCTKTGGFCFNKAIQADCTTLAGTSIGACQAQQYNCTWASGLNSGTKCANYGLCTSYSGTAVSCNALTDGLGLRCGSNSNTSASCIYANYCTDYNTGGSTTAITYCATLKDAFGNTCTANSNSDTLCSYPSTGNKYPIAYGQCNSGLVASGVCTAISASTACTALTGAYFTVVSNCKTAVSTCTWGSGNGCALASGLTVCTSYNLPGVQEPTTDAIGNTYCTQFSGTNGKCQYIGGGTATSCAEPVACAGYTATTTGSTLSAAVCSQFTNASGKYCGYDGTNCKDPLASGTACSTLTVSGANAVAQAQSCSGIVDGTTFTPCNITSGACSSGATTCGGYTPGQSAAADNATICQGYFQPDGTKCGFATGGTNCSVRTCGDLGVTVSNCFTYIGSTCGWNTTTSTCSSTRTCSDGGITSADICATYSGSSCAWVGGACVLRSTVVTCSQYAGTSIATCNLLFDRQGRQCGFTGGTNCSDYQCSQIPAQAAATTHAACQAINPACTASATAQTCVNVQTSCYKYTIGTTVGDCTSMFDAQGIQCSAAPAANGQCTYSTAAASSFTSSATCLVNPAYTWSGTACSGTSTIVSTCSGTTATGSTFAAQLAYCQSLQSNALLGAPCFFTQYTVAGALATNCVDSVSAASTTSVIAKPQCSVANISNTPAGGTASVGTGSDADCTAFSAACTSTLSAAATGSSASACTTLTCAMASATVAISTAACQAYQSGCIWNGLTGCIVQNASTCANITGTVTSCATFAANKIPCYQPTSTALTSATAAACANVTCANAPTTITTNAGCETWFPSTYASSYNATTNPGPNLNCVWTGTTGCTVPQSCSAFIGNATTCPTFVANDGPCKAGTGSNCTPVLCTDAPNSYNTDSACAKYANSTQNCLTTGYGCVAKSALTCTSIVNQTSCAASTLGGATAVCSWLSTCVSSVTSCTDSSLSNATLCTSTPVTGATCAWNPSTASCQNISCALLSATLTTHATCQAALSTCTTTGAGCITLGTCSSYTSAGQSTCLAANNQELSTSPQITKCIWANSACRVVQCTDNTTATTNSACNVNGLTNCVTTGAGCVTKGAFTCSSLTTAAACLVDGSGSPCLWINATCQNYTSCTSISWTTHAQCQKIIVSTGVTPACTSSGTTCISINACSNYTSATSCVTSNQQQTCGWLPANSKSNANAICQVFGACTDAAGATNAACALYGPSCISNGTSCIVQSNCASYTQYACNNNTGTDGTCFWQATSATVTVASCRTQQCGDVTAAYTAGSTTDAACALFPAPVINQCTTNGVTCVARSTCASYTTQLGCVLGTDGTCFWVAPAATAAAGTVGTCRVKVCTDSVFTTSSLCSTAIITTPAKTSIANGVITTTSATNLACVSNGTNCIAKSTCSSYVNQAACQGQGTDGACAFTPGTNATTPTIGTCALFSQCSSANSDSVACASLADRCFWASTTTGTTTTTSCSPITCAQASSGTCKLIPSFNAATYSICGPVSSSNSTCISQDGSALPASICFTGTYKQYTWNDTSSTCTYCSTVSTNTTTNSTTNTTTTFGSIIASSLLYGAIIAIY